VVNAIHGRILTQPALVVQELPIEVVEEEEEENVLAHMLQQVPGDQASSLSATPIHKLSLCA
jgi:hypothetical protein